MADESIRQNRPSPTDAGDPPTRPVYRLGVLGAGRVFETLHLPALRAHARWTATAVHDPDVSRLEVVRSSLPAVDRMPHAEALLGRPDLDAVLILTPPELHPDLTIRGLEYGRAVLVEKPLATSVGEAVRVVDAWRAAYSPVLVGFNRRHRPAYRALRERIADGPIRSVRFTLVADAGRWNRDEGPDDLLDDLASHALDLVPWAAGRPLVEVRARPTSDRGLVIEGALAGGTEVELRVGRGSRYVEWMAVAAADGHWFAHPVGVLPARLAPPALRPWIASVGALSDALAARMLGRPTQTRRSLLRQLDDLAARLDERPGLGGAGPEDGLRAVRAVEACRVSLHDGGTAVDSTRTDEAGRHRPTPTTTSVNDTTEAR